MLIGGIIAAGHGSRFKKSGFPQTKPLIKVGGRELLGRTVSQFQEAGIERIRIIFRSGNCSACSHYLIENFPQMRFDIICRDTETSAESFLSLLEDAKDHEEEQLLITTVDSIFSPGAFKKFINKAKEMDPGQVILGVTRFVDDEKPLYVTIDQEDGETITKIGGQSGDAVTCGVYLMPTRARLEAKNNKFSALRALLGHLFEAGIPFKAIDMGTVIDVDRPEDITTAEAFLAKSAS